MKTYLFMLSVLISLGTIAQTTYSISVSGTSFVPNTLTIDIGDSVSFVNSSGTHNVNGTQATFPSNPASFGNLVGSSWVYGFKFTIAGNYSFKCDVHPTMTGTISVVAGAAISEKENFSFSIYPNPTNDLVTIKIDPQFLLANEDVNAVFYDLSGKEVAGLYDIQNAVNPVSLEHLVSGIYFCSVYSDGKLEVTQKVVKY